jgi:hypothetical protein
MVVYSGATVSGLTVSGGGTEILLSSRGSCTEVASRDNARTPTARSSVQSLLKAKVAHPIQPMASFEIITTSDVSLFKSIGAGAAAG